MHLQLFQTLSGFFFRKNQYGYNKISKLRIKIKTSTNIFY